MTPPDPRRRGPRPLSDALGALYAAKGLGRVGAQSELEAAWRSAVGEAAGARTKVGGVRRGVLSVTVAHPALLEELSAFRKGAILASLRREAPGSTILDIRFRVGPVEG